MGRQGGHSPRSATFDLRWQATGRWSYSLRLQHPEGVYSSLGVASSWWPISQNRILFQSLPHFQQLSKKRIKFFWLFSKKKKKKIFWLFLKKKKKKKKKKK